MSVSDAQKENLPKVKFPARILEKLLRSRGKKAAKKHQEKRTYKGPLIISSKKKKFNHYQGQHYSDFSPQCLSSGGWKNKKSKGDFFTINATSAVRTWNKCINVECSVYNLCHRFIKEWFSVVFQNPAWQGVDDVTSFADLGLNDALVSQLRKLNIVHPTNIQVSQTSFYIIAQCSCLSEAYINQTEFLHSFQILPEGFLSVSQLIRSVSDSLAICIKGRRTLFKHFI